MRLGITRERHRKLFEIYFNEQLSSIGSVGSGNTGFDFDMRMNGGDGAATGGPLDMEKTNKRFRLGFLHSDYDVFLFDVESPFPEDFPGTYEKLITYKLQ